MDDEVTSYQFSTPLYTLIGQVTGLLDIHLDAFCYPVPVSVLENLKQRIRVRLHVSVTTFSEQTTAIAASEVISQAAQIFTRLGSTSSMCPPRNAYKRFGPWKNFCYHDLTYASSRLTYIGSARAAYAETLR